MNAKRLVCLALLVATAGMAACSSKPAPGPTGVLTPVAQSATVATPTSSSSEVPMGFTAEGAPYRGNPNAPVRLVEHSDFQ